MTYSKQNQFLAQLKQDEGFRSKPYRDTEGLLTIGYGTLLEDGITEEEAELLLLHRLQVMRVELNCMLTDAQAGCLRWRLSPARLDVIHNMLYNLGPRRLLGFKKMWAALLQDDYKEVATQMLDSKWARQVGNRATRLAEIMRTGNCP